MALRPLGHRVMVIPDAQPDATSSGLVLPQDHDHVPVSGTVSAVGPGGLLMRYTARQRAIRDCAEIVESMMARFGAMAPLLLLRDEVAGMLGTSDPQHDVRVGDRVVFASDAGVRVTEDGVDYLVLNEDDVVVVVDAEVAA